MNESKSLFSKKDTYLTVCEDRVAFFHQHYFDDFWIRDSQHRLSAIIKPEVGNRWTQLQKPDSAPGYTPGTLDFTPEAALATPPVKYIAQQHVSQLQVLTIEATGITRNEG